MIKQADVGPQKGEAVRPFFLEHGGPEPQRPRKAVAEKARSASGVPPRWRPSPLALAKQATCRPVSDGTVQERSQAFTSRVYIE